MSEKALNPTNYPDKSARHDQDRILGWSITDGDLHFPPGISFESGMTPGSFVFGDMVMEWGGGAYAGQNAIELSTVLGADYWLFHLNGAAVAEVSALKIRTNQIQAASLYNRAPTATVPGFSWHADDDTGIGRPAADELSLICNSVNVLHITETESSLAGDLRVEGSIYLDAADGLGSGNDRITSLEDTGEDAIAFLVDNQQALRLGPACIDWNIPATAAATGTKGNIRISSTHLYVCIAANTWVRAALATW